MKIFFSILSILIACSFSAGTWAFDEEYSAAIRSERCEWMPIDKKIKKSALIFQGQLQSMSDDATTLSFEIDHIYKGNAEDEVSIVQSDTSWMDLGGVRDKNYIVFANDKNEAVGCQAILGVDRIIQEEQLEIWAALEKYAVENSSDRTAAIEDSLERVEDFKRDDDQNPEIYRALYGLKAYLLEKSGKPDDARQSYEETLDRIYSKTEKIYKNTCPNFPSCGIKDIFKLFSRCEVEAPVTDNTPSFMRPFSSDPTASGLLGSGTLADYGKLLYKSGDFKNAVRAFCIAESNGYNQPLQGIKAWKILTLIKTGDKALIGPGPFSFDGVSLDNIVLDGISLRNSDFSGMEVGKFEIKYSDLSGAKFNGTKIGTLEAMDTKFQNATFRNVNLKGSIRNSDFSGATFSCSTLKLGDLENSTFTAAALGDSTIIAEKLQGTALPSSTETSDLKCGATDAATEQLKLENLRLPDLPPKTEIHAILSYGGRSENNSQVAQNVTVGRTKAPLALLFHAYEPTQWRVTLEGNPEIAAVILSGYGAQDVTGLPAGTKLLDLSPNPGSLGSRVAMPSFPDDQGETRVNTIAAALVGTKDFSTRQTDYFGGSFAICDTPVTPFLCENKECITNLFVQLRPLAESGNAAAQFNYGMMHNLRKKDGDAEEAYFWLTIALRNPRDDWKSRATDMLGDLKKSLPAETTAKTEKRAAEWHPSVTPDFPAVECAKTARGTICNPMPLSCKARVKP